MESSPSVIFPGTAFGVRVVSVEPLDTKDPLNGYDWDLSKVEGVGDGRNSPVPEKGIPLSEFMKGAKPKV